jgi:hypothetical protein
MLDWVSIQRKEPYDRIHPSSRGSRVGIEGEKEAYAIQACVVTETTHCAIGSYPAGHVIQERVYSPYRKKTSALVAGGNAVEILADGFPNQTSGRALVMHVSFTQ